MNLIDSISQSVIKYLQILDKISVREIGRKSLIISTGIGTFETGITSAFFPHSRNDGLLNDGLLNRRT